MDKVITLVIQTSNECNIICDYCYVRASRGNKRRMSIKEVIELIKNSTLGFDDIRFCWHGGEPLLMGKGFYQAALESQKELMSRQKIKFQNSLQTNGVLLDDNWISFFCKNGFSVGVSFDAPPEVNRQQRSKNKEESSGINISETSEMLQRGGLSFNALCVVSKLNVNRGEEIFKFFSSLHASSYSLLLMMKTSLPGCPEPPTNEELFNLYKITFELWLNEPHVFKVVEPVDTIVRSLLGEYPPKLCSFSSPCLRRMITITPDGDVVPCGSFVSPEYVMGNIFHEPLIKALHSKRLDEFRGRRTACVNKQCIGCEFISICRGGCREVAFWHFGSYDGEYPYCQARKEIFAYVRDRLKTVFKKTTFKISRNYLATTEALPL